MQLIRLDDGTHVWVQRIQRSATGVAGVDAEAASTIEAAVRQLVLK
jgi:TolB-like protein